MLPFLKQKQQAGVIVNQRKPDSIKEDSSEDYALESAAEDLIRAHNTKDIKAVAAALRAAFQILDAEPHEEGEHTNDEDNSFDSLNIKAAK
jgi:hypothetical protein